MTSLYSLHLVIPLGYLELVVVISPCWFFWYKAWSWGFAEPYSGHHNPRSHAASPQHIEWKETGSSHGHWRNWGHVTEQLRLKTGPPILHLRNEKDSRVLEKPLVIVQSVWAQALQLCYPLPPQDLLHSVATLSNTRRTARAHCVASYGNERAADAGGDPNHVVENTFTHRVNFVANVKPIMAAGEKVDQSSPAGLRVLRLVNQLLHKKIRCYSMIAAP